MGSKAGRAFGLPCLSVTRCQAAKELGLGSCQQLWVMTPSRERNHMAGLPTCTWLLIGELCSYRLSALPTRTGVRGEGLVGMVPSPCPHPPTPIPRRLAPELQEQWIPIPG